MHLLKLIHIEGNILNNYYENFEEFFQSAISRNDTALASALIDSILPIISTDHAEAVSGRIYKRVMGGDSKELQELFLNKFGLTSETAVSYIQGCLRDKSKERYYLDAAIKLLGNKYGCVLIDSISTGDLYIANKIAEAHSFKNIEYSFSMGRLLFDGDLSELRNNGMGEISSRDFKLLMNLLGKVGLSDLIEKDSFLFGYSTFSDANRSTTGDFYLDAIPIIDNGVINNPELFFAFANQLKHERFSAPHSKIPCFIKDGDFIGVDGVVCFKRKLVASINRAVYVQIGIEAIYPKGNEVDITKAENFISHIIPFDMQLGIGWPEGYSLSVIDVEVLMQLDTAYQDNDKLSNAFKFADSFYPTKLFSFLYDDSRYSVSSYSTRPGLKADSAKAVFDYFFKSSSKEIFKSMLEEDFWKTLYRYCSPHLSGKEIIDINRTFGFDDRHGVFNLDCDDIRHLYSAGFKFQHNNKDINYDHRPNLSHLDKKESISMLIEMGAWPSNAEIPLTCEDAIKAGVKKRNDIIYGCYLVAQGVVPALKSAKTDAQFEYVISLFKADEIAENIGLIPNKFRGHQLEQGLGL